MTRPSTTALSHRGPSCSSCADWAHGYAEGYAAGHTAGFDAAAGMGPAHPAVQESVARVFAGWAGPDEALHKSIRRVKAWATGRTEVSQ